MIFDIDLKVLEQCNYYYDDEFHHVSVNSIFAFDNIDSKVKIPLQYIYNLLYDINSNIGWVLSQLVTLCDVTELIKGDTIDSDPCLYHNDLFISELSKRIIAISPESIPSFNDINLSYMDDNQKLIVNSLLDYPSTIGYLGVTQKS